MNGTNMTQVSPTVNLKLLKTIDSMVHVPVNRGKSTCSTLIQELHF